MWWCHQLDNASQYLLPHAYCCPFNTYNLPIIFVQYDFFQFSHSPALRQRWIKLLSIFIRGHTAVGSILGLNENRAMLAKPDRRLAPQHVCLLRKYSQNAVQKFSSSLYSCSKISHIHPSSYPISKHNFLQQQTLNWHDPAFMRLSMRYGMSASNSSIFLWYLL